MSVFSSCHTSSSATSLARYGASTFSASRAQTNMIHRQMLISRAWLSRAAGVVPGWSASARSSFWKWSSAMSGSSTIATALRK